MPEPCGRYAARVADHRTQCAAPAVAEQLPRAARLSSSILRTQHKRQGSQTCLSLVVVVVVMAVRLSCRSNSVLHEGVPRPKCTGAH